MKALIAILAVFCVNSALASQPNLFDCVEKGNEEFRVGFAASSLTGEPRFSVYDGEEFLAPGNPEFNLFSLDTARTPLGTVVSGVVSRKFIADAPSAVYSLVVPGIMLGDKLTTEFETVLLIGTNGGFMPLPAVYQRIGEVKQLECRASKVNFFN